VFADFAQPGKSSRGWFYGFKLNFVINDQGDLLALRLTPGNVGDRSPVPALAEGLWGKLFGDRGPISQDLFEQLQQTGVQLITKLKRNRENKLLPLWDKRLLRKRALIENVGNDSSTCVRSPLRGIGAFTMLLCIRSRLSLLTPGKSRSPRSTSPRMSKLCWRKPSDAYTELTL
jgi:Transposase DDE domain